MSDQRIDRISSEMQKELSDIIQNHLKDPRITGMLSITKVIVTKDLRYAKVYVSVLGGSSPEETLEGLESSKGFIRKEIGKRISLRYTPEIIFELDHSIEYGVHISSILKKIMPKKEEEKK